MGRLMSAVKPPLNLVDGADNADRVTVWREGYGGLSISEDRDPERRDPIIIQIDDPRTALAIARAIFKELGVAA